MIPPAVYITAGAAVAGLLGGWTIRDWYADSQALAATNALIAAKDAGQSKVDVGAEKFEAFRQSIGPDRERVRETLKETYRNVTVPANCALLPDAVGVLEAARQRANAAAAGQSGEPMPADIRADPSIGP